VGDHVGIPAAVCFAFVYTIIQRIFFFLPSHHFCSVCVLDVTPVLIQNEYIHLLLVQVNAHFPPIYRRQHQLFLPIAKYFSTLLSDHWSLLLHLCFRVFPSLFSGGLDFNLRPNQDIFAALFP
jgi:hypothetical protein